jgi:aconitate hydratase/homoaconitate hydratase
MHGEAQPTEGIEVGELIPQGVIRTKAVRIDEPHIDTDRIIAGEFCDLEDVRELGRHALQLHKRGGVKSGEGGFRRLVEEEGHGALVAQEGWGTGSSREEAVYALIGAGVQVVIAKSIAYIHRRNLTNQALPFRLIHPDDQEMFYKTLQDGAEVEVDLDRNIIRIVDLRRRKKKATFRLLPIEPVEEAIHRLGGLAGAYKAHGARTFEATLALADRLKTDQAA